MIRSFSLNQLQYIVTLQPITFFLAKLFENFAHRKSRGIH